MNEKFSKQCAPNFILRCNTNFLSYISKGKKTAFPVILGETDQKEDQSKDILNSILEEELSERAAEVLVLK